MIYKKPDIIYILKDVPLSRHKNKGFILWTFNTHKRELNIKSRSLDNYDQEIFTDTYNQSIKDKTDYIDWLYNRLKKLQTV